MVDSDEMKMALIHEEDVAKLAVFVDTFDHRSPATAAAAGRSDSVNSSTSNPSVLAPGKVADMLSLASISSISGQSYRPSDATTIAGAGSRDKALEDKKKTASPAQSEASSLTMEGDS